MNAYHLQVLILTGINSILALGLNIITGYTGQLSLGHAAFMSIGAYTAAILTTKFSFNFLLAVLIGSLTASFFGMVLGFPTLRLRGDYLAIATLGFGEIVKVIILNQDITGGPVGLRGISGYTNIWIVLAAVVFSYGIAYRLTRSQVGRAFIAIREDELAADSMGINTVHHKVLAFMIGAFFAGLAGGLYAHYIRYVNPNNFGFLRSIEILSMVVIGGMGTLRGSFAGAAILTMAPELLRSFSQDISQYRQLIYGLLLIVVMIVRPQGLIGTGGGITNIKNKLTRKFGAERRDDVV